jgi:hypothetical protein
MGVQVIDQLGFAQSAMSAPCRIRGVGQFFAFNFYGIPGLGNGFGGLFPARARTPANSGQAL